jgi:hypothetical protein
MTYVARCCCQACEIEADGEPLLNALCHCDSCKRRTGGAFGWSAYFTDAQVVASRGEFGRYHVASNDTDRFFCAACATTLYWRSASFMPGHTGIAGGCFTATPLPPPTITANDAQRCAWVALPEDWARVP